MSNKVRYNLKNLHYAKIKETEGVVSYEPPVKWPGAVSLDMSASGELAEFYADGIKYYVTSANNGYSGTLEVALIPDDFRKDILGEKEDPTGKFIYEDANAKPAQFALLFEFDGNEKEIRHVLYGVTPTRPNISGNTNTATRDVATESISIEASPVIFNGIPVVKAKTQESTTEEAFAAWYAAVPIPTIETSEV